MSCVAEGGNRCRKSTSWSLTTWSEIGHVYWLSEQTPGIRLWMCLFIFCRDAFYLKVLARAPAYLQDRGRLPSTTGGQAWKVQRGSSTTSPSRFSSSIVPSSYVGDLAIYLKRANTAPKRANTGLQIGPTNEPCPARAGVSLSPSIWCCLGAAVTQRAVTCHLDWAVFNR